MNDFFEKVESANKKVTSGVQAEEFQRGAPMAIIHDCVDGDVHPHAYVGEELSREVLTPQSPGACYGASLARTVALALRKKQKKEDRTPLPVLILSHGDCQMVAEVIGCGESRPSGCLGDAWDQIYPAVELAKKQGGENDLLQRASRLMSWFTFMEFTQDPEFQGLIGDNLILPRAGFFHIAEQRVEVYSLGDMPSL